MPKSEGFCAACFPFRSNSAGRSQITQNLSVKAVLHKAGTAEAKAVRTALKAIRTAQEQVAGIRAGADPTIYASMLADIAARRKALHTRRAASERTSNPAPDQKPGKHTLRIKTPDMQTVLKAFEQAWRVLTGPAIEGRIKRDLLLAVIDRVICQKDGAEVIFLSGIFGEAEESMESTLYTTCMGISTHR